MNRWVGLLAAVIIMQIMHSAVALRLVSGRVPFVAARTALASRSIAMFSSSRQAQLAASTEEQKQRKKPGNVEILNAQRKFKLDQEAITRDANTILQALGVGDQSIEIEFCSERRMREVNRDFRDIDRPTDILSFPTYEFVKPGKIDPNDPFREAKFLGELVVCLTYVEKRCKEDLQYFQTHGTADVDDDLGVSRAMAQVFDPLKRLPLLLVHGILHLMGYDHETETDWKQMTAEEERILKLLPGYKKDFDIES